VGSQSLGVLIESCLMHNFPEDKGVSIGERSLGIVVRDCVIWDVDSGVSVKDSSEASIVNCTIVDSGYGFRFYEKISGQGGGHAETWNNIIWNNDTSVQLDDLSSIHVEWSDVEGGYAGQENVDVDPGFRDTSRTDYRLVSTSSLRGLGRDGEDLGARYPVGSSLVDTDGDRLPDPWELQHDLDFNDSADGETDPDGDGLDNLAEYWAGTLPQDGSSRLGLTVGWAADSMVELGFEGVAGRLYAVEFNEDLGSSEWITLANPPPFETDDHFGVSVPPDSGERQRWYRVRLIRHP
jgi:hypothetical protein